MPDESCRKCGGTMLISPCRHCKYPIERVCKYCENIVRYVYHYCKHNIISMPYACAVSA